MSRPNVLVVSDSRGQGLASYLKKSSAYWTCFDTRVIVVKGAKLQDLRSLLTNRKRPNLRPRGWDTAVLAGGLCNFTERTTVDGLKVLQYHRDPERVAEVCEIISQIKHEFGSNIHIATIPPALLAGYLTHHNRKAPAEKLSSVQKDLDLEHQQFELETDLKEVNDKITELNIQFENQTINLAEKTYSSSVKKKKTSGRVQAKILKLRKDILQDGVHCARLKQHIWFERIRNIIENSYTLPDSEAKEVETGNFKRVPRKSKVGSSSGQPSGSRSRSQTTPPRSGASRASEVGSGSGQPSKPKAKLRTSATSRARANEAGSGSGQLSGSETPAAN
jgi:hypothetical protein